MIKFMARLLVFLIAIGAILAILLAGVWYVSRSGKGAAAQIDLGGEVISRRPENIEEYLLGLYLQFRAPDINTPLSNSQAAVDFSIETGESAVTVAKRLADLKLISDPDLFRLFLRYHQLDNSLEAGNYQLTRNMNMRDIALALQRAKIEEVAVIIKEGWRAEEIADELEKQGLTKRDLFMKIVREGTIINHPLLADRPAGTSYEGYLYPDTYRFAVTATPSDIIQQMIDNLTAKMPPDFVQTASSRGLTFYQVITVASIVEREAVLPAERPQIASVYLNRIAQNMYLNADPTVQYAMGYQADTRVWWKTPVTLDEYQYVDSPYNTYLNIGLPPGPICSPRIDSILAVLNPAPTDYLYFVAKGDGSHIFAHTLEEQEQNIRTYQGQ